MTEPDQLSLSRNNNQNKILSSEGGANDIPDAAWLSYQEKKSDGDSDSPLLFGKERKLRDSGNMLN